MPTFNIKDIPESKIVKLVDLSEDSINEIAEVVVRKIKEQEQTSIVHGHNTNDGVRWFRCSECGWGMNDIYMADESMVEDFDKFPYYCPYCGAKMDEVEDGIKQI